MKSVTIILLFALIAFAVAQSDVAFIKIGTFEGRNKNGENYKKSYYVPRYFKSDWQYTRGLCKDYDYDLVSIQTAQEFEAIKGMCSSYSSLLTEWTFIGGMTSDTSRVSNWYWVATGEEVSSGLTWQGRGKDGQTCLSLGPNSKRSYNLQAVFCFGVEPHKFICESIEALG